MEHQHLSRQPMKRPLEDLVGMDHPTSRVTSQPPPKRPRLLADSQVRRSYKRYPKPPYTYLGMIVVAIESSPTKQLTLSGVQDALCEMFPFFKGSYVGWRDSVRHFLSSSPCFTKLNRKQTTKRSKGCLWAVDLSLVPKDAFKRLKVPPQMEKMWAPTLTQQLRIPTIAYQTTTTQGETTPDLTSPASLRYTEAQYTRYLRHQTQGHAVPPSQYPPFTKLLYHTPTSGDYTDAAVSLHQLCPEPDYGSPVRTEREWTTKPTTPTIHTQPTALLESPLPVPEGSTTANEDAAANLHRLCLQDYVSHVTNANAPPPIHCVPYPRGNSTPGPANEAAAFLEHFVNSLAESNDPQNDINQDFAETIPDHVTESGQIIPRSFMGSFVDPTYRFRDTPQQQTISGVLPDVNMTPPTTIKRSADQLHCSSSVSGDISVVDDVVGDNDISILSFQDIQLLSPSGVDGDYSL